MHHPSSGVSTAAARADRSGLVHALLVGVMAAAAASSSLFTALITYDGGISASAATFMLHGDLPYRDFWLPYGPGSGLLVAAVTWVFGPSVLLLRFVGLFLLATQAATGYWLLRRAIPHLPATLISIGAVAPTSVVLGLEPSAWGVGLTLALLALAIKVADDRWAAMAGAVLGLAFVARLDVGLYGLIAMLILPHRRRTVLAFASVAAPFALISVATTPLDSLVEQLVWFPIVGQRLYRGLVSPELFGRDAPIMVLPLVIVPRLAIIVAGVRLAATRRADWIAALAVFAALCQLQTQGRADFPHMAQAAPAGFLLIGLWLTGGSRWRAWRLGLVATACTLSLALTALGFSPARAFDQRSADFLAAVETLGLNTGRTDAVFVGLRDHEHGVLNPILAYYLADRHSAVRVAMFNPGVTTTERVQSEMVSQLEVENTRVLLVEGGSATLPEQENLSRLEGSHLLDDYIDANYSSACRFGVFEILQRSGSDPPLICSDGGARQVGVVTP